MGRFSQLASLTRVFPKTRHIVALSISLFCLETGFCYVA